MNKVKVPYRVGAVNTYAELTPQQIQFTELRAKGKTITEISKTLEVSRQTLYNWQEIDGISEIVQEKTNQVVVNLGKRVLSVLTDRLSILENILTARTSRTGEKIRAYSTLLSHAKSLNELGEINQRLTRLEQERIFVNSEKQRV